MLLNFKMVFQIDELYKNVGKDWYVPSRRNFQSNSTRSGLGLLPF